MTKPLIVDIVLSIPIAGLLILFINKLIEILTMNMPAEEKIKKNIIIAFIIGIISILIGWFVFYKSAVKNIAVMLGLYLSAAYLTINSLLVNWNKLSNDTKLFMLGTVLVSLIVVTYL